MHQVDVYLDTLKSESAPKRKLYSAALGAWKKYTRENLFACDVDKKDIDGFIFWGEHQENWKLGTIIEYLVPLGRFLGQLGNQGMKDYVLKRIRELRAYMKTMHKSLESPVFFDVALKMLKTAKKTRLKLCLWLLAIEGMSNRCLSNLRVGHIDPQKQTYEVPLNSGVRFGLLHHCTMKIVQKHIDESNLKANDRLIDASERTIENWVKKHAKRIGLSQWKVISPGKLRYLGKNNELRELLIREYKKTPEKVVIA